MWLVVNNEMWNLDNAECIVAKGNKVMTVYPDHSEQFETSSAVAAASVVCGIEAALNGGQRIFKFEAIRKSAVE